MFCSKCGAQVVGSGAFCSVCGAPMALAVNPADVVKRPGIITLLAVLHFIGAAFWVLAGLISFVTVGTTSGAEQAGTITAAVIMIGVGLMLLACGAGLWQLKPYGRILQLVLAWIGLLGIPIGTVISIFILVYMFKPGIKALFSGKAATDFTPVELAEIGKLTQGSQATVIIVVFIGLFGCVFLVGIIAAIAVPSLLKARMSANEVVAQSTIRNFISAEVSYASANGGPFGAPECLVAPSRCIPGYSGSPFLDDSYTSQFTKSGYTYRFTAGASQRSPASVSTFSFVAVPISPGTSGIQAFCGDGSGQICKITNVRESIGIEAVCPANCVPIIR